MAKVMGWKNLKEISIPDQDHPDYYKCRRILQGPISIPDWTYHLPNRKSKYLNPEILKKWCNPRLDQ
jgi:hypothetical protein